MLRENTQDTLAALIDQRLLGCVSRLPTALVKEIVLAKKTPEVVCLGGSVFTDVSVLYLILSDWSEIEVPLSIFAPSGTGLKPDFADFEVTDWGQTLRFGEYEAAVDAVLADARLRDF